MCVCVCVCVHVHVQDSAERAAGPVRAADAEPDAAHDDSPRDALRRRPTHVRRLRRCVPSADVVRHAVAVGADPRRRHGLPPAQTAENVTPFPEQRKASQAREVIFTQTCASYGSQDSLTVST